MRDAALRSDKEPPLGQRPRFRLGRILVIPLLVGFLAVPACFYLLPPQEALDRWNFATGVGLPIAMVLAVVASVRRAPVRISILVGVSALVGAVCANVGLAALRPVHDRRYCEAHQLYALRALQQAADSAGTPPSCALDKEGIKAAFDGSRAEHFSFSVERVDSGCAFSATGEGYQAGCDITIAVQPDGAQNLDRQGRCQDLCF